MTKIHTLPKTGARVPGSLSVVTLRATGQMETRNGVAFTVTLSVGDGHLGRLGTIENQGNGGGSWFHHVDVAAMRWWQAVVDEYAVMPEALEDLNKTYVEAGIAQLATLGNPAESLAEMLVEEAFA